MAFPHHLNPEVRLTTIKHLQDLKLSEQIEERDDINGFSIEEVNSDDKLWRVKNTE